MTRSKSALASLCAVGVMCVAMMAIGVSGAAAEAGTKLNMVGTASNVTISSGGHATKCEKITFTGQATEGATGQPTTGTVTNVVSTGCVEPFWNLRMTVTLKSPWTVSILNSIATVTNANLHVAITEIPTQCSWDLTTGSFRTSKALWALQGLATSNAQTACVNMVMAKNGPASLSSGFNVTYTPAS